MTSAPPVGTAPRRRRGIPRWTMVAMIAALVATLLGPDWTGTAASDGEGVHPGAIMIVVAILLGLVGAGAALVDARHTWISRTVWAIVSALWGVALVAGLITLIYAISGP